MATERCYARRRPAKDSSTRSGAFVVIWAESRDTREVWVVDDIDHADIVAGQGTVGLEILEQRPDVTVVYVPAGGGGLIAGVALLRP